MLWKDFFLAKLFPLFKAFTYFLPFTFQLQRRHNELQKSENSQALWRIFTPLVESAQKEKRKARNPHKAVLDAVARARTKCSSRSWQLFSGTSRHVAWNEIIAEHSKCTLHASKLIKLLWLPIMHTHSTVDMNNWITLWMRTFESFNYDWFRVMLT